MSFSKPLSRFGSAGPKAHTRRMKRQRKSARTAMFGKGSVLKGAGSQSVWKQHSPKHGGIAGLAKILSKRGR